METNLNKLLLRQIKKHFGSIDNIPDQLKGMIQDINNTYENFEDDFQLLQNSIEINSQELRDAFDKQKLDAETQKETINKIKEAIYALKPAEQSITSGKDLTPRDSNYLFEALIKLIEERNQTEETLNNERVLFRTIIDLIPDAVYVKDFEGRKILANPREVQFSGKDSEIEIIGKTDAHLYPDEDARRGLTEDQIVLSTGKSIFDIEGSLTDREGQLRWLLISKVPLRDVYGKVVGLVGVTHDITARKKTENELKQASTRLALATRAGGVGVWDLNLVSNNLIWDDQMFTLYGADRAGFEVTYETWMSKIHPEDVAQVNQQIKLAIGGEKEFDAEFRVIWPDGSVHNIRALATVHHDAKGNQLYMVGTNWDITEQKETEANLLISKLEADSANKAKSEFLANMSHEIRTPLNGVIGFTDLLLKTPLNKIQQQYTRNANTSGHALLAIINDILDFSKIEAGKMELNLVKSDIIELVEQTSDIIKYHASQKGLELLLNIQNDIPRNAVADPARLKQILVNLLGNAVKFTEKGEVELKVTFSRTNERLGKFTFSVRDTGIGISEEQQKLLFKAFSQADNSTTRKFGGTGLGLTISNMLAEKMGSKIEIVSEIGSGSNFYFTLESEFEEGDKPDSGSLAKINRLLVIDDNDNNRMILEHTCRDWGIEYVGIGDGRSAIKLIANSKPFDVIIVDYHMPRFNGLETIKMIREQLQLTPEKQPIILLHSSSDDIEIYEECKNLGVVFNLTKPLKSKELHYYLRRIHQQSPGSTAGDERSYDSPDGKLAGISSPVILVAEDVIINMILVTTLIKQMVPNVTVIEAKNGREAYNLMITKKPDLIIMDLQMPVMSGIEATVEIRKMELELGVRVPIVALTAGAIQGEKERCLEAGMDDFLTKPLDQNTLQRILGKHLTFFNQHRDNSLEMINQSAAQLHFDQQKLMESIGNSRVILAELLEVVPLQFANDIASLHNAINERKLADVKSAAYAIKGTSLNMWFNKMAELAKEIEALTDQNHLKELEEINKELVLEWELIKLLLKNIELA